jgi:Matrixin/Putative peptidoglycan binding domain
MAHVGEHDAIDAATIRLSQLGYLSSSNRGTLVANISDREIELAVRTIQRRYGLPQTGKFDLATIGWLTRPGCGVADENDLTLQMLARRKWPRNNLTFSVVNGCAGISRQQAFDTVQWALDIWSAVTPLHFAESAVNIDLLISFVAGDHGDGFRFDGKGGTLAHAFPPGGNPVSGDVHFDAAEDWSISSACPPGKFDLYNVALHEIGHALGLPHSNISGSIMFPSYQGPQRYLDDSDERAIQDLYGTNTNH